MSERPGEAAPGPTAAAAAPTVRAALAQARDLGLAGFDAQWMLAALLGRPRSWLIAHDHDPLPPQVAGQYAALAARRALGEPMAYLLGEKEFFGLTLEVGPAVLVPRPDTETLVEWALTLIPQDRPWRVLDLGTGSGAIALALQSQRPQADITAIDASAEALVVARANARRLSLPVRFLQGSWLEPVAGERFDLIVSNPPYIADGDVHLADLRFEPQTALTAGPDGLSDLRQITAGARAHLAPRGWLLLEHGYDQAAAVQDLLRSHGWQAVSTRRDLGGQERCTGGHA